MSAIVGANQVLAKHHAGVEFSSIAQSTLDQVAHVGFATSDKEWCQVQLGLKRSGLRLHSLPWCLYMHLTNAIEHFNAHVSPVDKLSVTSVVPSLVTQKFLSSKVDDQSSPANKDKLLSHSFVPAVLSLELYDMQVSWA